MEKYKRKSRPPDIEKYNVEINENTRKSSPPEIYK